jgi:4-amino-4-deoxy-L-arabinose transferase-like glycosyltransferase
MRLRPLVGVLWILLLVLPWFVAIMGGQATASCRNRSGRICFAKIFQGQETHGAPPGYYLLLFWVTFWPAAPLPRSRRPRVAASPRAAAALPARMARPCWIVFELVVTKLPHYVLPLYPAIAILIAREIERRELSNNPHLTRFTVMWPIFMAVIPAAAVWLVLYMRGQFAWPRLALRRRRTSFSAFTRGGFTTSKARSARSCVRSWGTLCMIFAVLRRRDPLLGRSFRVPRSPKSFARLTAAIR